MHESTITHCMRVVQVASRASCAIHFGERSPDDLLYIIQFAQPTLGHKPAGHPWRTQVEAVEGAGAVDGTTNRNMDEGVAEACLKSVSKLSSRALQCSQITRGVI